MKIENTSATSGSQKAEAIQPASRSSALQGASGTAPKDRVEVTASARLLASARTALEHVDETGDARVQELKQQIENGSYTIPVDELAGRLLAQLGSLKPAAKE